MMVSTAVSTSAIGLIAVGSWLTTTNAARPTIVTASQDSSRDVAAVATNRDTVSPVATAQWEAYETVRAAVAEFATIYFDAD